MNQCHSIVWKGFEPDTAVGKKLRAEKDFGLPYFIEGVAKEEFETGQLKGFQHFELLLGLLVGFHDLPPSIDIEYSKSLFPKVLEDLRLYYGIETLESLILDASSYLRRYQGDVTSLDALDAGLQIIPNSSKILFDYCVDLYNLLERNEYCDRRTGLQLLQERVGKIQESQINVDFRKYINIFKTFINTELLDPEA